MSTAVIDLVIRIIDLAVHGLSAMEAWHQLSTGITAIAESEGRDVSEAEQSLIKGALAKAKEANRGA